MQATLDAFALKPFTRALTCLSKYGDDLTIYATPDSLSLSATNSSLSAYCRVKYGGPFFSKYSVGGQAAISLADEVEGVLTVTGQLLTKSLLSILRHRTVEKTVEKCELSIVEGNVPADRDKVNEDHDSLESKLIVRLHCKHGVIKTHRLLLLTPTSLMAPGVPEDPDESRLTIGPKAIKDMIEHFPLSRGPKSDPQLIWNFGDSEVDIRSLESSVDTKVKAQLSTELTISADEFDVYEVHSPPITIAFHLREFNATVAYAESMSSPLDLRFTDPAAPLFIEVEGDNAETLFVISTSQVYGTSNGFANNRQATPATKKREREESVPPGRIKKPMKAVQRADPADVARAESVARSQSRGIGSMPPASFAPLPQSLQPNSQNRERHAMLPPPLAQPSGPQFSNSPKPREPLFLPSSSQLSAADEEVIRATGLGIEDMGAMELEEMLTGDGEEVALDLSQRTSGKGKDNMEGDRCLGVAQEDYSYDRDVGRGQDLDDPDSFELVDEIELAPTQSQNLQSKAFRPLFED